MIVVSRHAAGRRRFEEEKIEASIISISAPVIMTHCILTAHVRPERIKATRPRAEVYASRKEKEVEPMRSIITGYGGDAA